MLPSGLGGNGSSYKIFSINSEILSEKNGGLPTNKHKCISQIRQTSKWLSGAMIWTAHFPKETSKEINTLSLNSIYQVLLSI